MQFDVLIQNRFYKTISAANTGEVLAVIAKDISAGIVPDFDGALPHNIVIKPNQLALDPFEKWAAVAPQNPARFDVWLAPDDSEWIYDQPRGPDGRYISDNPDTLESESSLRWQPHTQFNVNA
jgi:hypothetical protein